MVAGCLLLVAATQIESYSVVLVALFVIASGITLLQVVANPLAAVLGSPARSHLRLTLAQAFNSLGTVLTPLIGSSLLLGGVLVGGGAAARTERLSAIGGAFGVVALAIAVLGLVFWLSRRRIEDAAPPAVGIVAPWAAFRSRWALAGAAAIFLYVGAEVAIGSVMINYLMEPDVLAVTAERAGYLLGLYWSGGSWAARS